MPTTIIGTADPDDLASSADGQLIYGLGGDDRITVGHDRVQSEGGTGNDTITVSLSRVAEVLTG